MLIGGPGNDVLDGGPGDNILIQDSAVALNAPAAMEWHFPEFSFATTASTHGIASLTSPPTTQPTLLAHPHA